MKKEDDNVKVVLPDLGGDGIDAVNGTEAMAGATVFIHMMKCKKKLETPKLKVIPTILGILGIAVAGTLIGFLLGL